MTTSEYESLKRFPVNHSASFTEYLKTLHCAENTIFECYTLSNTVKYIRITNQFEGVLFDIKECTPGGDSVRCPYMRNSNRKEEIAERLYDGDWRLYSNNNK
jgi:hypothetical protein